MMYPNSVSVKVPHWLKQKRSFKESENDVMNLANHTHRWLLLTTAILLMRSWTWPWGGPWCMAFQRKVSACGKCIIQIKHTYYIQISHCYSEWDEESFKKLGLKRYNRSDLEDPCNGRQEPTTCDILKSWGTEGMGRGGVSEIPEGWWGMVGSSGGCK